MNVYTGNEHIKVVEDLAAEKIAEIRKTPTTISVSGQKYYVSADGNDLNDGKTPECAWKSFSNVNSVRFQAGDGVFFRRGDTFRGCFTAMSGVTYSAYGEGDKPKILGSPENGADASKWALLNGTDNVWTYYKKLPDVGHIYLDGEFAYKEIPDWYNQSYYIRGSEGKIPFDLLEALDNDLDFFCDLSSDDLTTKGTLYLRCDKGNPGEVYESIEFGARGNIININKYSSDIVIDNLCLMHCGSHGIGSGWTNNLTVSNCEIGIIGGAIQRYNLSKAGLVTRFGNGIEIYGSCDGYTVDNCYVYQCYDAGMTHQYCTPSAMDISMYNITYSNNVIEKCVYSIEYFNTAGENANVIREGKNYKITGNILRLCGYGWGQQRYNPGHSTHLQGGSNQNKYEPGTFIIENNIFDRGLDSLVRTGAERKEWGPVYRGNTYIQTLGYLLGMTAGTENMIFDDTSDAKIKEVLGDKEANVYTVSNI